MMLTREKSTLMPPKKDTSFELSDSELDELASDDESEERKPEAGPYGGAISKPRHVTTSCKSLHGKSFDLGVSYADW
jgi:hypothetical protein